MIFEHNEGKQQLRGLSAYLLLCYKHRDAVSKAVKALVELQKKDSQLSQ